MGVIIWIGKNLGLLLGILELVVKAIIEIIAQILKVIAGIVNILQPSRQKDALVAFMSKLEGLATWVDSLFTNVKKWLYSFGGTPTP